MADEATLLEEATRYFEDIEENPLWEEKTWQSDGGVVTHEAPRMRAMSIRGISAFLGISDRTWRHWRDTREDLQPAIAIIEGIIYNQKFEGAAAGFLNQAIIARELGLADETKLVGSGPDGQIMITNEWSEIEIARRLAFTLAEAAQRLADNPEPQKAEPDDIQHRP